MISINSIQRKTVAIEQAKIAIKESLASSDTLIDQRELANMLSIDIKAVERAYDELVEEGIVHKETYFLWKNPVMRRHLLDAMKETKTYQTLGEICEALGIERKNNEGFRMVGAKR